MSYTDPKNEVRNVKCPEYRAIITPNADAGGDQVSDQEEEIRGQGRTDGKGHKPGFGRFRLFRHAADNICNRGEILAAGGQRRPMRGIVARIVVNFQCNAHEDNLSIQSGLGFLMRAKYEVRGLTFNSPSIS